MNSIEKLGYALQDVCLDIADSFVDAINNDPRKNKINLFKIAKNVNRSLKEKDIQFFKVFVTKQRTLDIDVLEDKEDEKE